MRQAVRRLLQRAGFDIVRVPHPYTLAKHLQRLLPALGVDCVLDVGANVGQYAGMLRGIGFRGWIVSFEPASCNLDALRMKATGDPRWKIVPLALGEEEGEAVLHVARNSDLSSLLPVSAHGRRTFPEISETVTEERVPVRRLDNALDEALDGTGASRLFLKVDTEGFDVPVFRGASGCMDRLAGVQIELPLKPVFDGMADVTEGLNVLRAAGFDVTGLFAVGGDASMALTSVDCVARRRG